jgi:hypothetical protein
MVGKKKIETLTCRLWDIRTDWLTLPESPRFSRIESSRFSRILAEESDNFKIVPT